MSIHQLKSLSTIDLFDNNVSLNGAAFCSSPLPLIKLITHRRTFGGARTVGKGTLESDGGDMIVFPL